MYNIKKYLETYADPEYDETDGINHNTNDENIDENNKKK